jgi:hypothetical protein
MPSKRLDFDHIINWPNGRGSTRCTAEYAAAVDKERELMGALREMEAAHEEGCRPRGYAARGYPDLYEAAHRAAAHVIQLHAQGHMGPAVRAV